MGLKKFVKTAVSAALPVIPVTKAAIGAATGALGGNKDAPSQAGVNAPIGTAMDSSKMADDIARGEAFGERVLGKDGLGRLGTDPQVQEVLNRYKAYSEQGYNAPELQAMRDTSKQEIDRATQTQSRQLLAQLARSGIRGGAAAQRITDLQAQSMQQKAQSERDLMIKNADLRRQMLGQYAQSLGDVKTFDIGQLGAEKNIRLQSGLGMAQMGAAERGAVIAGQYSAQAAAAQKQQPGILSRVFGGLF